MKCNWRRCRSDGDYIAIRGDNLKRYDLCQKHWVELTKQSGSVCTNVQRKAIAPSHRN